jgi:hypothetical protein
MWKVSAIGLGCMRISFGYGPAKDEQEMVSMIRSAVDNEITGMLECCKQEFYRHLTGPLENMYLEKHGHV